MKTGAAMEKAISENETKSKRTEIKKRKLQLPWLIEEEREKGEDLSKDRIERITSY